MKRPDFPPFVSLLLAGRVARGAVLSLAIRVGAIALLFAQAVLIARLLGPAGYGRYAVVLSVASLLAGLSLLGLSGFAVREVSRLRMHGQFGAVRGFVRWASVLVLMVALGGGAAMAALAVISNLGWPSELVWGLAIVPLMAMLLLLRGVSQGLGAVLASQAPTDLVRPAAMVLALATAMVISFPVTVDATLSMLIAANVLAVVVAGSALRRIPAAEESARPAERSGSEWIRGAAPFFGSFVLVTFHMEINTLLLGLLAGPMETGLFQPLLRFLPIMVIAVQAVTVPLAPRISELWEKGETQRLQRIINLATIFTTAAVIVTCAALLVLAPWILSIFGSAFTANVPALLWLAGAQTFNAACGPVASLLNMTGHQRRVVPCLLIAVMANFALGLWLIPHYGAHGAAIAMSIAVGVWNILMLREVVHKLGFNPSLVGVARQIGQRWLRET